MDRRAFLKLSNDRQQPSQSIPAASPASSAPAARVGGGINPYAGPWGSEQVTHLLKRTMFGATRADINYFKGLSMDAAVDLLVNAAYVAPAPPVNNYGTDVTNIASGATWVHSSQPPTGDAGDSLNDLRNKSWKAWWFGLMVNQGRSLNEKMTLFWHNHFVTETMTVKDGRLAWLTNDTLRRNALGNFKTLTREITLDPGMLVYLNGYLNSKEAADENYARELQELFTVGKGPDSHYTEDDVRAAARVLTGYRVNFDTCTTYFQTTEHDSDNKQFSDFYSAKIISGQTGPSGQNELDALLEIIFAQVECAKFICRKLYRFFVYYIIDDAAEKNVIAPLATLFINSNYEIKPVLSALFKSEHFFDPGNMSCLIKSPIDFVVGMCREFNIQFPNASDYTNLYSAWDVLRDQAATMLQDIGSPPLVAGWAAYYQEPQYHEIWINNDTLPKRNKLSDTLSISKFNGLFIDALAFAAQQSDPGNAAQLITDSLEVLFRMPVSDDTKTFLASTYLLGGQTDPNYWTNAWTAYTSNPGDAMAKKIVNDKLTALYKGLMDLSEYQLS
ncbi:DUF1800 domain-containing protein [Chitinophaga parva]|uniref:DUF1800 domain-containing protein n=1 Tax=Chitinophaga parva TaxID=2169414 RepID=A0A2T7BN90_9BACT|nr:DUF1800 domain-containing protein [Chitinophaga parva]PUZ29119.1 DUF1800 domain-containing protein [Chitinophaga parva]